jgi:tetratricopeptide (TPR) repeat protein
MNRRILISLTFILSFLCCGYTQVTPLDNASCVNETEDTEEKIEMIKEKSNEDFESCYFYLGVSAYCISETLYDEALSAANKALLIMDNDYDDAIDVYRILGITNVLVGNYKEGKKWFKKARELNPQEEFCSMEDVLVFCVDKGDFITSAKILKEIEREHPEWDSYHDTINYKVEVCIKEKSEDYNEVFEWLLKLFKVSVDIDPNNYKAYRAYGIALRDLAFYSESKDYIKEFPVIMEYFQKALDLNDQYIPTYVCIANAYDYLSETTLDDNYRRIAMEWFYMADDIDPGNVRLASAMGYVALKMEDYDVAIEKLEITYKNFPSAQTKQDLATAYNNKAYNLYTQNINLDYGLELIDKAIELLPNNGVILGTKAELLYKKGEYEEAHKYITKALELEPGYEEMQQDLINIEAALSNKSNAAPKD